MSYRLIVREEAESDITEAVRILGDLLPSSKSRNLWSRHAFESCNSEKPEPSLILRHYANQGITKPSD
jgi:hypothetical protein